MAPVKPKTFTAGENPALKFEGAIEVTIHAPPPGRNFYFNCKMYPHHPRLKALEASGQKPPAHFHPRSWEYMEVVAGKLTIEINGIAREFASSDGEVSVPPGTHHSLYATSTSNDDAVEFWLSAKATQEIPSKLDQVFFENWYGYQEEMVLRGVKPDLIQILSMFDAGDSYLSLPRWVPFRSFVGYWAGVVLGRWIGGLLGYQPFFPQWTTDWDAACDKMESHWTQRKFAVRDEQQKLREIYQKNPNKQYLMDAGS